MNMNILNISDTWYNNGIPVGDFIIQISSLQVIHMRKQEKIQSLMLRLNGHRFRCRIFQPADATYLFLSAVQEIFYKIDCFLGHKSSLNKYKRVKHNFTIFSNHRGTQLEINSKRNHRNCVNTWRVNNAFLNDQWTFEEISGEIWKFLESNEDKSRTY